MTFSSPRCWRRRPGQKISPEIVDWVGGRWADGRMTSGSTLQYMHVVLHYCERAPRYEHKPPWWLRYWNRTAEANPDIHVIHVLQLIKADATLHVKSMIKLDKPLHCLERRREDATSVLST
jgi:hypothetical protein